MKQTDFDIQKITGLTPDSRSVKQGYLFAALPGTKSDGRNFIPTAIHNGAIAILTQTGTELPAGTKNVDLITDDNPRRALALMAADFYDRQPEFIAAVTGTNGKTSTVHFTKQLWKALGEKAASIGTLGVRAPGLVRSASMTTPDPVALHAELADLAAVGVTHLAMEASSHGLDQHRLDGVHVSAAAFTNLTRDHLDYHADMESYFEAKARLFTAILKKGGAAVLNADIPEYEELRTRAKKAGHKIISVGRNGEDIHITAIVPLPEGQKISFSVLKRDFEMTLPLVGEFQVMNALCALALVIAEEPKSKKRTEKLVKALENLKGVPGRLQLISGHPHGAAIYIDYAHTPNALENALKALRPHTDGTLVCLFGCGGDRDKGKRPVMGKIAHDLADLVIVTDDNPRSEDPARIRSEIMQGAEGATETPDRRMAIQKSISALRKGDVLVIAGKGHEQGQVFSDRTEPFDDAHEAQSAILQIIH